MARKRGEYKKKTEKKLIVHCFHRYLLNICSDILKAASPFLFRVRVVGGGGGILISALFFDLTIVTHMIFALTLSE